MFNSPNKIKIINDFEWYYKNGYITTRDGNACFVTEEKNYMITATGVAKHELTPWDFVTVDRNFHHIESEEEGMEPSIEAPAHVLALQNTGKKASVHVHSPNTVALFELGRDEGFAYLEEYIKSNWPEFFRYTNLGETVPYLEPGSEELHNKICQSFAHNKKADIIVLERHGVLAVGDDLEVCREHIQRLEHVSSMILKIMMANGGVKLWKK